jgi:hypothetical protein
MDTKPPFRITDIQRATVNGRKIKLFRAYRLIGDAYIFSGQYAAPVRVANKDLFSYVDRHGGDGW